MEIIIKGNLRIMLRMDMDSTMLLLEESIRVIGRKIKGMELGRKPGPMGLFMRENGIKIK